MKKLFFIFFLFFVFFLIKNTNAIVFQNPLTSDEFNSLITNISSFLFWIAAPVASLIIAIAAFIMLTGGGNPEKIKQAKNMIIWALVGLIIIFLSIALVNFLKAILGVRQ